MEAAYSAFVAFDKGSGHPAGLNFGDVLSYAFAKVCGLPLLFKGDDFSKTDLRSARRDWFAALEFRFWRRRGRAYAAICWARQGSNLCPSMLMTLMQRRQNRPRGRTRT